ncbi:hypothetical protein T492DRAFT_897753 [Pavlovales sp. CCMP2436]|nr:hypothetical protein T492DRAFT_897753 [Pavlovales sp. CCMP2436]
MARMLSRVCLQGLRTPFAPSLLLRPLSTRTAASHTIPAAAQLVTGPEMLLRKRPRFGLMASAEEVLDLVERYRPLYEFSDLTAAFYRVCQLSKGRRAFDVMVEHPRFAELVVALRVPSGWRREVLNHCSFNVPRLAARRRTGMTWEGQRIGRLMCYLTLRVTLVFIYVYRVSFRT